MTTEHATQNDQAETGVGRAPSFVHIGGQRCGSSWIHKCLGEHPEVFVAEPKELHYFTRNHDKGDAWYLSKFAPRPEHKAWGEATPMYISWEPAAEQLAKIAPGCKLMCCLRNPIDRAYSIYQLKRNSDMAGVSFEDVLEKNVDDVWDRGLYKKHLDRWLQHFPRENLLIQLYDDLVNDERRIMREIYSHIGVDPEYKPSWLGKTQNAVILPQAQDKLRKAGLGKAIRVVRDSPLGPMIRSWAKKQKQKKAGSYGDMNQATKKKLAEFYAGPNRELGQFLGVDLSHWTPREFR